MLSGEQLTLLRSESGEVYLVDSYCPHLGANLSIGGRVVNENCIQVFIFFCTVQRKCLKVF